MFDVVYHGGKSFLKAHKTSRNHPHLNFDSEAANIVACYFRHGDREPVYVILERARLSFTLDVMYTPSNPNSNDGAVYQDLGRQQHNHTVVSSDTAALSKGTMYPISSPMIGSTTGRYL